MRLCKIRQGKASNNVKLMDWIPLTSTKSEKDLQPKKFRKKMVSVLGEIWFF